MSVGSGFEPRRSTTSTYLLNCGDVVFWVMSASASPTVELRFVSVRSGVPKLAAVGPRHADALAAGRPGAPGSATSLPILATFMVLTNHALKGAASTSSGGETRAVVRILLGSSPGWEGKAREEHDRTALAGESEPVETPWRLYRPTPQTCAKCARWRKFAMARMGNVLAIDDTMPGRGVLARYSPGASHWRRLTCENSLRDPLTSSQVRPGR